VRAFFAPSPSDEASRTYLIPVVAFPIVELLPEFLSAMHFVLTLSFGALPTSALLL